MKRINIIGEQHESYIWKKSLSLLGYNPMAFAKVGYIVSLIASYFTNLTLYCGTCTLAKNALLWTGHYSGSTCDCGRSANLSKICSNFICRLRVVIRAHTRNLRAVVYITTKLELIVNSTEKN